MATAGDERRIGGWWKMYPTKDDPKFCRLDDLAFRLLFIAFEFASDASWEHQRRGWLYHNEGFAVAAMDFQRCVPHHPIEEVETALDALCTVGGAKHTLLLWDGKRRAWRVRAWRKWQDGFARDFARKPPENRRDSTAIHPHKTIDIRRKTVDVRKTMRASGDAGDCPWCKWTADHRGDAIPEGKRFRNQRFHDLACERLRVPCYRLTQKDQRLLSLAAKQHGEDLLLEWWGDFLSKSCDVGHTVPIFNARLQKYAELEARRQVDPEEERP